MANLQVKDFDDQLYQALKSRAGKGRRSLSKEVTMIIEKYLNSNSEPINSTEEFLKLSGTWTDDRSSEEIICDIHESRS